MSNQSAGDAPALADLPDGAGCTEIWETLSESRETATDDRTADGTDGDWTADGTDGD